MNSLCGLFLLLVPALVQAQQSLTELSPQTNDNVEIIRLATDKHASQFLIFVRQAVKNHRHLSHSETIYVLEGRGQMQLGDRQFAIGPGDFIQVPEGVVHGVRVSSDQPLKVLSVQAPEFDGTDRVWVEAPATQ